MSTNLYTADDKSSSSSDEAWVDPEDYPTSTTNVNINVTEIPADINNNAPHYQNMSPITDYKHSCNRNHELAKAFLALKNERTEDVNMNKNTSSNIKANHPQITSVLNSTVVDANRMILNKDTGVEYDIDDLPIEIMRTSMHSLERISVEPLEIQAKTEITKNKTHKKHNFFGNLFHHHSNEVQSEEKIAMNDKLMMEDAEEEELEYKPVTIPIKMKGNTRDRILTDLRLSQTIKNAHKGSIFCLKFSERGDYLASGGQDSVLRIWTVCGSNADGIRWNPDLQQTIKHQSAESLLLEEAPNATDILNPVCLREYTGHRSHIIDICWSKEFILSASTDQTVLLWHTSKSRCLCLFQHSDVVTAVQFHPEHDYLFISGSLDSRVRLWNILDHKVIDWVQVPTVVTSATFSVNGKYAVIGCLDGQCFFYAMEGHRLSYATAIECRNSSGKYKKGTKVTGVIYRPVPKKSVLYSFLKSNEIWRKICYEHGSPELLVSTNDSRIRLFHISNFDMKNKYKGHTNIESHMYASFSADGKYIISASEDNNIYIWRIQRSIIDENAALLKPKMDRNEYYEYFKSHGNLVRCALFSPNRTIYYTYKFRTTFNPFVHANEMQTPMNEQNRNSSHSQTNDSSSINATFARKVHRNEEKILQIIITGDSDGHIHIYTNHTSDVEYHHPSTHLSSIFSKKSAQNHNNTK